MRDHKEVNLVDVSIIGSGIGKHIMFVEAAEVLLFENAGLIQMAAIFLTCPGLNSTHSAHMRSCVLQAHLTDC